MLQYDINGKQVWVRYLTDIPGVSRSSYGRLAISTNGYIYHTDLDNKKIHVYSMTGTYMSSIQTGTKPWGICIDTSNQWLLVGLIRIDFEAQGDFLLG